MRRAGAPAAGLGAGQREDRGVEEGGGRGEQDQPVGGQIARLERELAQKEQDLKILGKALAFFARRTTR